MARESAGADRAARIFLVAGEPSGDRLGGALMAALKRRFANDIAFAGIGGEAMAGEGLSSLFPMRELTLMGFAEVLPHLPRLLRRLGETVAAIERLRPDLIVTIDSPGFNGRLLDRLRGCGVATAHYVAPAVWAWRPGRIRRWVGRVDRLLAILPFEPPIFAAAGIDCHYVGHPALERAASGTDGSAFRRRHGIDGQVPLVCLLPGSRPSEIRHILPVFRRAVERLLESEPGTRFVLPTLPTIEGLVRASLASWHQPPLLLDEPERRFEAFAAADVALAASGTVTLELAVAGTPTVLAYRTGAISAAIARRLIRVRYVGLPNLLLGCAVIPELLQERCRPDLLADAALALLRDPGARAAQKAGLAAAVARLAVEGRPSDRAADALIALLERRYPDARPTAPVRGPWRRPPVGCRLPKR
jgi:lipid-A-disaccharide synthase